MWLATTSEAPIPLLPNTGSVILKAETSSVGRKNGNNRELDQFTSKKFTVHVTSESALCSTW